jgi:hypothetical protein
MSTLNEVVDSYLAVWNDTDAAGRRARLDALWAADGSYTDPLATTTGRDEFDAMVAAVQQQFAGLQFTRGGTFDQHHNLARFTWDLVPGPGAEPVVTGFDVLAVNEAGQVETVFGFLDKVPPAA